MALTSKQPIHHQGFNQFMSTFAFRADPIHHVFELMLSRGMGAVQRLTMLPDQIFPDAHVIADTLRQCDLKSNPIQGVEDLDPLPELPEF